MTPHPGTHTNRLANETSPYLLQHQHNPVDWYAWGEEAFEAARSQNKPIFLSVGYSTCYWCHVMERQSFENPEIAKLMNERFINIKVDREERPDVDQLYMTAVQVMTRQGGWPMSVWLTPDLRPFFGGTYFPPQETQGRPGFAEVTVALAEAFQTRKDDIEQTATRLTEVLAELAQPTEPDEVITFDHGWLENIVEKSIADYEPEHGGFGRSPKFPRETLLELLIEWIKHQRALDADAKQIAMIEKPLRHTLDAMASGGIRDQLGGGFHRYSTDNQWLIPHFEIMLYDNALLGWIYAEASRVFNEPRYERVARGIFDFVLREMTSPEGAFYTAFDAEVDAQEGLNYLWTMEQIEEVLSPREASRFATVYGVDRGPNFVDPHHGDGVPKHNVLYLAVGVEQENDPALAEMRQKLYEHRLKRKKPLLDTKIITSWNALMIRALARAGDVFGDVRYMEAAGAAANFLLTQHLTPDGGLYRTSRDGEKKVVGFLDDYAELARALLELHAVTHDAWVKEQAVLITENMRRRFEDADKGGFYFTDVDAKDLIVRQKVGSDSPLPAGNAVAATVCDLLGHPDAAARALGVFAVQTTHHGEAMSSQSQAVLHFLQRHGQLRVEPGEGGRVILRAPQDEAVRVVQILPVWIDARTAVVELVVAEGYHLSADAVVSSTSPRVATVEPPLPVRKRFAYSEEDLAVFEDRARFTLRLDGALASGESIPLRISYQACTDSACLPMVSRSVSLTK